MKRLVHIALAVGALGAASVSFGQGAQPAAQDQTSPAAPEGRGGHHHGNPMWHLLKQLNLTADQKTQIQGIFKADGPARRDLHEKIRAAREAGQTKEQMQALFDQAKSQREQVESSIRGVLTDDQAKQFDQLLADLAQKWKDRHAEAAPE